MTFSSETIKAMISHLSSSRGLETFSDLDYENETLAANMTSLCIMQGQQHLCETFGSNFYDKDDTHFVFIGLDGRLRAIHSVTMDTEPTAPRDFRYVGIASDTITSSAFVKINDPQLYFRTVLSIASKKDVKNSNFEEITLFNPDEINKPPPAATGPNTLAELGFENANGDDLPCFTFVPLLLPIPPSFYIPVGHAITADLPPAPTGKKYLPAMTIWTKLMKYLATRNNSTSLEVVDNNLLFNATIIDIPNIANDWDTIKSKTIHLTVENIEDHLIPTLPSFDTIKQKLNSTLTNWFNHTEKTAEESVHLAAFMSPTATTHAAAATSTVGTHGLKVFSSAIRDSLDAFTNKKTSKEKSNERAVQQSQHKFSNLLAVSGRDLTCPTVAVEHTIPANLRQEFTDILEEANAKCRHTEYKQLFMSTLDKAASEGKNYASLANWTKEQMDFALAAHIFDFAFHTEPLTSTQDSIASMVSVFNFCPVHALNVSFGKRTKNERFVAQSNLVDDNPKTHHIATTELFIDGEQATLEHVRQTVANLLVFLDTISHGASNSSLGQILLQISSLLGQSTTRAFFEKNTPKYPHLPHQVLLVIQDIFNTYVSMAVDTSNLRQVADPAGYIQHTVLHNTENKSVLHLSQLRAMFASSATSAFREPPTTWTAFSKDTRPTGSIPIKEVAGGAAPGKRTPVDSVGNDNSNKKKKSDDSVERKREALKKKGFLLYTGTSSRVTPIDLTFPVGTGRGRLCIGHCFRGRNCKNSISGTSCTYAHIDSLSNLSAEDKANLIAAVAATPTISWAPGCGPANTVHQLSSFATCIPPSLARPFIDSVTTHQPATQPIAVDSPPPPTSTAAQLTTASPLNITMEEDFTFPTKSSILANVLGKKDPVLSKQAPTSLKIREREILVDTLEQSVQDALNSKYDMSCGKRTRILESLPPESRTLIAPSLDAVFQCEMGASDKTKQLGRVRAMRIHFIWFLRQHHLYGSFFPVNKLPLETLNYLMASYAAHLGTGHTLSARLVKVGTIKTYIAAAASLCMAFDDDSSGRDPRKMLGESNLSPPLKRVCDELKRWEDIPDRREPWTVALQLLFQTNAADAVWSSKEAVLSDWFGVIQLAGGRRGEWAQDRGRGLITNPDLNARGDPAAFCLQDINFFASGKKKLTVAQALATPKAVETVLLKWRMQKNGEEKQFSRNEDDPKLCVILKWINIVRRFVKFFGYKHNVPMAVYRHDDTNNLCYISSADIEDGMQRTAIELYELDTQRDKDDIKRFSAHSLRVGACVILQALGFQDHQIQQLLRWKSDKWRTYTRNLFIMTKKHNRAVFEASKMPNF